MPNLIESMQKDIAYTTKEVAEILNIEASLARSRLQRAFDRQEVLKKNFNGLTYWARK